MLRRARKIQHKNLMTLFHRDQQHQTITLAQVVLTISNRQQISSTNTVIIH